MLITVAGWAWLCVLVVLGALIASHPHIPTAARAAHTALPFHLLAGAVLAVLLVVHGG